MKRFFTFIFNVLRNVSLLIVLCLVGLTLFFISNKEATHQLLYQLDQGNYNSSQETIYHVKEQADFESEAIDEPALDAYKSRKFKIPIKGGYAYLRPSQIMYINSGSPCKIITIKDTIETKLKLYELDDILNQSNGECFFRIKSAIINCNYVQQLAKESTLINNKYIYQHKVIMEDGEALNLSPTKAEQLIELLDELTF